VAKLIEETNGSHQIY